MNTSPRDRITVDLQGLKGALLARAAADGVMPSQVARRALRGWLGEEAVTDTPAPHPTARPKVQRLCLRMRPEEASTVMASAARAGQRPGRWLARLASGGPGGSGEVTAQQLDAQHAALVAMTAELAAVRRRLQQLASQSLIASQANGAASFAQVLCDLRTLLVGIASQTVGRQPVARATVRRTKVGSPSRSMP